MGARWSYAEDERLFRLAETYFKPNYEGVYWDTVAEKLNLEFHHDRTPSACATRWSQTRAKYKI